MLGAPVLQFAEPLDMRCLSVLTALQELRVARYLTSEYLTSLKQSSQLTKVVLANCTGNSLSFALPQLSCWPNLRHFEALVSISSCTQWPLCTQLCRLFYLSVDAHGFCRP